MKTHTLTYTCILNAPIQDVFDFHTNTRNLPLITPPWIKVGIVHMEAPIKQNSKIILDIKRFGLKTRWEMKIGSLDSPHILSDIMLKGPFRVFVHERTFYALGEDETKMDETLTIALPFGWLGECFFSWIKQEMDTMFAFRHRATQNYFLNLSVQ